MVDLASTYICRICVKRLVEVVTFERPGQVNYIIHRFCGILCGMEIKRINTPNAPQPAGHYSQATVYNGLVFVAGQLAIDPTSSEKKFGSIEEQTEQALKNVHAILKAAGSDWDRVLKINISLADINLWEAVNKTYASVLGDNRPARAAIPCSPLHHGFLIEIEAIAAMDS